MISLNALTLLFISPLVVAVLSPFILGERFDIFIGAGVLIGFIGVISSSCSQIASSLDPTLLFALVAGFLLCPMYIIITKKLSFRAPPVLTLFYSAIVGIVIMTPFVVSYWTTARFKGRINGGGNGFFCCSFALYDYQGF